jgi:hypothetical protein
MASNFFSGLVGAYSQQMLRKHQAEKEQHINELTGQLNTLVEAAATGRVRPEYRESVMKQIDELQDEIAGKKSKGGFHISNLIGRFQDTGQQGTASTGGVKGGQPKPGAAGAAPAAPSASGGAPATRRAVVPSSDFGATVTKGLYSPEEMDVKATNDKIAATVKTFRARADALSQDLFGKSLNQLNPQEKQQAVRFAYSLPDAQVHPIPVVQNGKVVPALMFQDGSVIGPDGKRIENPEMYEKGSGYEDRVAVMPGGKLASVYVNKDTHEAFDYQTGAKIPNPQLLPQASYLPTTTSGTTVEPSYIPDPNHPGDFIMGPAVTRKVATTHSRAIPAPAEPPKRAAVAAPKPVSPEKAGPPERAATAGLPWAAPKGAVQTPAQLNQRVNATMATFRKGLSDANSALAQARRQLAALQKEERSAGVTKAVERNLMGVGGKGPDVVGAQADVAAAQAKAENAQRAVTYIESMRQSIIDGTVPADTVEKIAQQLATQGYSTIAPPNVTRQVQ